MQELANILFEFIFKQLTDELIRQGHKLTGALIESFEGKVREQTDSLDLDFLMLVYGRALNDGILPERIPYTVGGPPRGGKSKYIEGLIDFALKKFTLDKKRATSIAFAIARKQKEKGYPLTGKIGFIDNVLSADSEEITNLIADYYEVTIQQLIEEQISYADK
ncbi:hypothetical protein AB832_06940 [Flavobacteriaceae bacterium (ex Bugula neritina AB1)]|nr:hypothetical protein AB832_06940 [Flavobacteriaceae bacterium (ex Bugula neritina AB1)]